MKYSFKNRSKIWYFGVPIYLKNRSNFISAMLIGKKSHDEIGSERMGPGDSSGYGGAMQQDKALATP